MRRDENDQWKIKAQFPPGRIQDAEMDLNDAIESAQEKQFRIFKCIAPCSVVKF